MKIKDHEDLVLVWPPK